MPRSNNHELIQNDMCFLSFFFTELDENFSELEDVIQLNTSQLNDQDMVVQQDIQGLTDSEQLTLTDLPDRTYDE